jgi:hypothetical protein
MFVRDFLIMFGSVWLLLCWPVYHLTGSYSLLREVSFVERWSGTLVFALMSLTFFVLAWRSHRKECRCEDQQTAETWTVTYDSIVHQDDTINKTKTKKPTTTEEWLKRWRTHEHTHP